MNRSLVFRFALVVSIAIMSTVALLMVYGGGEQPAYAAPAPAAAQDTLSAPPLQPDPVPVLNVLHASGGPSTVTVCPAGLVTDTCQYNSIQAAVNAVAPGGTVKVASGVYTDSDLDGWVVYITQTITLRGGYTVTNWTIPNPDANPTILDGQDSAQVVRIASGTAPLVEGFHIRNGSASSGGGVYVAGGQPTLRRNRIYDNEGTSTTGGGGGGVYILTGAVHLENNLIYTNSASARGGGVHIANGDVVLIHNTFFDNYAALWGGGIYINAGSLTVTATILAENTAAGPTAGGGIQVDGGTASLSYSNLWNNSPSDSFGVIDETANITQTTLFVDAAGGNFALQPASPCIDHVPITQTVAGDLRGWARPFAPQSDIGAYEYYTGTCFARINYGRVYTTVQAAVDASSSSADVVRIAGYCTGSGSAVVTLGKVLVLRGGYTHTNWVASEPDVYTTTIDGQNSRRGIYIGNFAPTVEGLHIVNGSAAGGGGIYVLHNSPTITNNRIYNNVSSSSGAAIYVAAGSALIAHNDIHNNTASGGHGGGVYVHAAGGVHIRDNSIHHNAATSSGAQGGGVWTYGNGHTISGNTIYNNQARLNGGGIYANSISGSVSILDNDIYLNETTETNISQNIKGGGIFVEIGQAIIRGNRIYSNDTRRRGGGICAYQSGVTIEQNEIYDNDVLTINSATNDDGGGGIYGELSTLIVRDNDIHHNRVGGTEYPSNQRSGGGIHIEKGTATIERNAIYHNIGGYRAGAIFTREATAAPQVIVRNNLIYNNSATTWGGGIYNYATPLLAENNTLYANGASTGGGIYIVTSAVVLRNNIVVNSTAGGAIFNGSCSYCDIWNNTGGDTGMGAGSISADPLFVSPGSNFRLQNSSPCIDTIASPNPYPTSDYDNYVRPFGAGADMGAHEAYPGTCFARVGTLNQIYGSVQEAVDAATSGAVVKIAGTCTDVTTHTVGGQTIYQTVYIDQPLTLSGGYTLTNWTTPEHITTLDPQGLGRAIYITGTGDVDIDGMVIRGGSAITGGGIYLASDIDPTLQNLLVYDNSATNGGGFAADAGSPYLYNNTFVDNSGGALYLAAGLPTVENNIVVSNTGYGIYATASATPSLAYNDVWQNTIDDYGGNASASSSDFSANPRFADYAGNDFHLSLTSPCLHVASYQTGRDLEGDSRAQGRANDVGADEATFYPDFNLSPAYLEQTGVPGRTVRYNLTMENTGSIDDVYDMSHVLDISGTMPGWSIDYAAVVTISAGASAAVPLTLSVPSDAISGTIAHVTLSATSRVNDALSDQAVAHTIVNWNPGSDMTPTYSENANPGSVITLVHTLLNTGNSSDTFSISWSSPSGWVTVTPTHDISLDIGMTATLWVRVAIPPTAAGGLAQSVIITATSQKALDILGRYVQSSVEDSIEVNYTTGTRYVATSGSDALNNCLVMGTPCRTIAYALSQAASGDTIRVASGTYLEHDVTLNKNVTLRGGYTTANWAVSNPTANPTIIDAQQQGRVIYLFSNSTVEGFTLQNGSTAGAGGGIYVYSLGTPSLRLNRIVSNTTAAQGGGIYIGIGAPLIQQNVIVGNVAGSRGGGIANYMGVPNIERNTLALNAAQQGGGFSNYSGNSTLVNNLVYSNTASADGGGIYVLNGNPSLWHNTLYDNLASQGGGILVAGGNPQIRNTIVAHNAATTGGGIYRTGGTASLDYNDVWSNTPTDYVGVTAGANSLSVDPLFVNPTAYDLRLQTQSTVVDEGLDGLADVDYWGDPRPVGPHADIGADESRTTGVLLEPPRSGSGQPSAVLVYTHTMTNTGNYTDTFDVTWLNQDGWTVTLGGATKQPQAITLGPAASTVLTVRVTVAPSGALSGTLNATIITATSQADTATHATVTDTTTVEQAAAVLLEPDYLAPDAAGRATTGQSEVYTHILTNTGNYTDTFNLTFHSSVGLNVTLSQSILTLPMGGTATVVVTVTVPGSLTAFHLDTTVITATSTTVPSQFDTATDQTFVNRSAGVLIEPDQHVDANPDDILVYTHILTNTGDYTDTFSLSETSLLGWSTELLTASPLFDVGPGMTRTVQLEVQVPGNAPGGTVEVSTVFAASFFDSGIGDSAVDTTTVSCVTPQPTLTPPQQIANVWTDPANPVSVVYVHTLTNRGNCVDQVFSISVDNSNPLFTAVAFPPTVALDPNQSATIYVTVTVDPATPNCNLPAQADHAVLTAAYVEAPDVFSTATDTTVANQCPSVAFWPDHQDHGQPGDRLVYTHTLQNTGNYTDSFVLSLDGLGAITDPLLPPGGLIRLEPDESTLIRFELTVPLSPCGTLLPTVITATSIFSPAVSATVVNTTTVDQLPGVEMSADQTLYTVSDDVQAVVVTATHVVTNTGNCTDTFALALDNSAGWTVAASLPNLVLGSGATSTVLISITTPLVVSDCSNLRWSTTELVATSGADGTVSATNVDTTVVNRCVSLQLEPDNNSTVLGLASGVVQIHYVHVLTNTGNYTETFDVTRLSSTGWTTSGTNRVWDLRPGESSTVHVYVDVPQDVYTVTEITVVTGSTQLPNLPGLLSYVPADTATDTTLVRRPHVTLSPNFDALGAPSTSQVYVHTLDNSGGVVDSYDITGTNDLGWIMSIAPLSVLNLAPGDQESVTVTLQVPPGMLSGTIDIASFLVTSRNYAGVSDTVVDTTTIPYVPGAEIAFSQSGHTAPGTFISYTHSLQNTGNYTETFELRPSSLFGNAVIAPDRIENLRPGETRTGIVVTVLIPPHAAASEVERTQIIVTFAGEQEVLDDYTTVDPISATRYVAPDGRDSFTSPPVGNNCADLDFAPCATLQHAVDQAVTGDEIRVASGQYTDIHVSGGMTQVLYLNETLTLRGGYNANDWDEAPDPVVRPTVLDAGGQGRVLYVTGAVTPIVEGLVLQHGAADDGEDGGGVYIDTDAQPTLRANVIYSNTATSGGGVYYAGSASPLLERNTLDHNSATSGAGIYLGDGNARIWNNVLYRNVASGVAGAIYVGGNAPTLWNNTILSNTAVVGGGLYMASSAPVLSNTIVVDNDEYGIYLLGGSGTPTMDYNNVWQNTPANYGGGLTAGTHSISQDPLFVSPTTYDLHVAGSSPCIDNADPNTTLTIDRDGNLRPLLVGYDMGAYEYGLLNGKRVDQPTATPGSEIEYTIVISNVADTTWNNTVVVSDTLSPYVDYVAGSLSYSAGSGQYDSGTRTVEWSGTLEAHQEVYIVFRARIADSVAAGVLISNVAYVNGEPTDPAETTVDFLAGTRYVTPTGSDIDNNCLLPAQPCATVQWAVDQSVAGDQVWLAAGTYSDALSAGQVVSISRSIALIGGHSAVDWSYDPLVNATILDGNGTTGVRVDDAVTLIGLHLTDTSTAVAVDGGGLTLEQSWLYGNVDGVVVANGSYMLVNDVVAQNSGDGLRAAGGTTGTLLHNTFADNGSSGATVVGTASFTNTIFSNHALGVDATGGSAELWNTLWYSNTANTGSVTSHGDVYGDPIFAASDYHILPGSAAIDSGLDAGVSTDVDNGPRPLLSAPDIGADEFPLAVTKFAPATADPGETISYVVRLEGSGSGLSLNDVLPAYVDYAGTVDCTAGTCSYVPAQRAVTWSGNLFQGYPVTLTYTAQITSWLAAGVEVLNTAQLDVGGQVLSTAPAVTTINAVSGVRYVTTGGSNTDNNCLQSWTPCRTIQHAVDQALAGDEIRVAQGTYTSSADQVVDIARNVTLVGGYDPADWSLDPASHATVVDGGNIRRGITVDGTVTIIGLRVINATEGILVSGGNLTLQQSWVTDDNDGVVVAAGNYTLLNNVIARNNNDGLRAAAGTSGTLLHNTLADNDGSGATIAGAADFTNTILAYHALGVQASGNVDLSTTLWWNNTTPFSGAVTHSGDLTADPAFVDAPAGDYHLNGDSPALGAGEWAGVSVDVDLDTRPSDQVDIGADQYPLRLARSAAPNPTTPCAPVTHLFTLTNLSADPLTPISLSESLPGTVTAGTAGASSGTAWFDGSTLHWNGTVDDVVWITCTVQLDSHLVDGTAIVHNVTVTDPISTFDAPPYTVTVETLPVTLDKLGPAQVATGDAVEYTVVLTVPTGQSALTPVLVDTLPRLVTDGGLDPAPAMAYVAGSASAAPSAVSADGGTITWTLSSIYAGCSGPTVVPLTFTAQLLDLSDNTPGDLLTNTVVLDYEEDGSVPGTASAWQTAALIGPDLVIAKSCETDPPVPGYPIVYTIIYTNSGAASAGDVQIVDTLPELVDTTISYDSSLPVSMVQDGRTVTWTLSASLDPDVVGRIWVTATILSSAGNGAVLTNTVHIATTTNEQDTSNNDAESAVAVGCIPPGPVFFTYSPAAPRIGETVTFTGTVDSLATLPIDYTWDWGEGTPVVYEDMMVTTIVVTHSYSSEGVYNVVLTAANVCDSDSDSHVVTVELLRVYLPLVLRNH